MGINEQRIIIKDGIVTIMFNQYTFDPNGDTRSAREPHYDHNIEIPLFEDKWTCHTCNTYWDAVTDADYRDEVAMLAEDEEEDMAVDYEQEDEQYRAERQAEYDAENGMGGFY